MIPALPPEALYRACDPAHLDFEQTDELTDLNEVIGQARAMEAVHFGIGMPHDGYNLYLLGPSGLGKHTLVRQFLTARAEKESTPNDWCYVNNFDQPQQPRAIQLPPGEAVVLSEAMRQLIEDLLTTLPAAFDSEEYRNRTQALEDSFSERHNQAIAALQEEAEAQEIKLFRTPGGYAFAPLEKGEVISPEEFKKLSQKKQQKIEDQVDVLQEKLHNIFRLVPQLRKQLSEQLKALEQETALSVVGHFIDEIRLHFSPLEEVQIYLNEVQRDILNNVSDFLSEDGNLAILPQRSLQRDHFKRYSVNVIIDHSEYLGAPVIYEDHPILDNLIGRAEHISYMGTLSTDFTLIKPGALHRANNGYLLLDANKVLSQPYAWEGLKRALRAKEIHIESLGQALGLLSTQSLEPEPIALDVKVVLVGDRILYYLLCEYDPDFGELFKVAADFESELERNEENTRLYARFIATLIRREELKHFSRDAVAKVIEHCARKVEDAERLSTHMGGLLDLLREANYWAKEANHTLVERGDVQQAINAQISRADRIHRLSQDAILRDVIMIDTQGKHIAQVNGLTIMQLGHMLYGQPVRITATARIGESGIIDIEREVELGGPIHSKGVMVISSYLSSHYAREFPLSVSASLVFEQSYGEVEGDSASMGELCCLLSALAEVPIKQSLAITGSVNQHGMAQAIGGVNEKIEGFFDVCQSRGLNGEQGVLIPKSNVKDLMLREEIIEAARDGRFHIYPFSHVNEAIALLTDMDAGKCDSEGNYPETSINGKVQARLLEMAHLRHEFGEKEKEGEHKKEDET